MRLLLSIILTFQFFTSQNCASKENEDKGQSWLNVKYIECLKNSLPCECEKTVGTYFSLALNADQNSKNFGIALVKFEQMEPYMYPIKKMAFDEYAVLKNKRDTSIWAKIFVKGEELQFIEGNTSSKFIKSITTNGYSVDHYFTDNVKLLNQSFTARGYSKLEEIVNDDSLRCHCNNWLGKVNLLSVKGAPKSWIIEMKNDSVQILRITNTDRDPDDPVQTEKVASYKWK